MDARTLPEVKTQDGHQHKPGTDMERHSTCGRCSSGVTATTNTEIPALCPCVAWEAPCHLPFVSHSGDEVGQRCLSPERRPPQSPQSGRREGSQCMPQVSLLPQHLLDCVVKCWRQSELVIMSVEHDHLT